jgi:hypothetical protein
MSTMPVNTTTAPIPTTGIPTSSIPVRMSAPSGNTAVATAFSPTPSAAVPAGGIGSAVAAVKPAGVGVTTSANGMLNVAGVNVTSAQSGIAAAQRVDSMITGAPQSKGFAADVKNAITALTSFAQSKMDAVQANIKALMNSEGGEMNAAKLQVYSQELSSYETMMQMAAKLQEKQDRAAQIWVR